MSALELKNWLPVETKVGKGYAFIVEMHEADNWYTVILDSRAIVTVRQQDILMQRDYSHQRGITHEMMRAIIERAVECHVPNTAPTPEGRKLQNTQSGAA